MAEDNRDDQNLNSGGADDTSNIESTPEELKAQIAELEKSRSDDSLLYKKNEEGLVAQIKELRAKVREEKPDDPVTATVKKLFFEERQKEIAVNREVALNEFWSRHKEFHPDNDPTGLKRVALESALKRLNTSESFAKEQILSDFEDALKLMNRETDRGIKVDMSGAASSSNIGGEPKISSDNRLNVAQEKLRQERGWTVEKYLEMHSKYPKIIP